MRSEDRVTSAVLVQERRQAGRIASVESRIDSFSIVNFGDGLQPLDGRLEFDVSMAESSRTADSMSLKYEFTIGTHAHGSGCKVAGEAVVRFGGSNTDSEFSALDTDAMAVEIFRKNYEIVYLMHTALGMPAPSPWITEDVSVSSRNKDLAESNRF